MYNTKFNYTYKQLKKVPIISEHELMSQKQNKLPLLHLFFDYKLNLHNFLQPVRYIYGVWNSQDTSRLDFMYDKKKV